MLETQTDADSETISHLLKRLTALEDERAILRTLHLYGQYFDAGLADEWAGLFTEDGLFVCTIADGREVVREQGREALAAWARNHKAHQNLLMKHLVIAPVVTIDGDNAKVVSSYANMVENQDRFSPPHVRFMGRYIDDMTKAADGIWRFRRRTSETDAPLLG